uniref:Uncharacterized protein n=1 Tax=Anguilla anguilla TaxID=7936 RepID=A0A0E9R1R5_ANGAN
MLVAKYEQEDGLRTYCCLNRSVPLLQVFLDVAQDTRRDFKLSIKLT